MKYLYWKLAANILAGFLLATVTFETVHMVSDVSHSDYFGWISLTAAGPAASLSLEGLLVMVILVDTLWAFFFIMWLVKKGLRVKDSDNTLYLP